MFFLRLLEKDYLRAADRDKGRFRTFLLVALKRFLCNEWDRARTAKRGGGIVILPLDTALAESKYLADPSATESADRDYERRWALTLLERAVAELRGEYERVGKLADFEQLKGCLTAERGTIAYTALASGLRLTEAGARVAVHRIRKRFRELFRAIVLATVSAPAELEDEVRHLVSALSDECG